MTRYLPWALLVLALAFGGACGGASRNSAFAQSEVKRLSRIVDSVEKITARVDTQYVNQTETITLWRDSVVTLRDSLTITDTVEVVRFIAAQDSTIAACSAALLTCDERVRLRDARFDAAVLAWRAREAVLTARVPTRWQRIVSALTWMGAGMSLLILGALAVPVLRR